VSNLSGNGDGLGDGAAGESDGALAANRKAVVAVNGSLEGTAKRCGLGLEVGSTGLNVINERKSNGLKDCISKKVIKSRSKAAVMGWISKREGGNSRQRQPQPA